MERRDFLTMSSLAAFAAGIDTSPTDILAARIPAPSLNLFSYNKVLAPHDVEGRRWGYGGGATWTRPSMVVPVFYDESNQVFLKSRDVQPELGPGTYLMHASLRGAHVSKNRLERLTGDNLQCHFYVGAMQSDIPTDVLSWLVLNGIRIFGDTTNIGSKLIEFKNGASLTGTIDPGKGIEIPNGRINLSIELYGHRKESWWEKLLRYGQNIIGTPVFAQLGLPMLVKQALDFTTVVLNKIREKERLVSLLETPPISYTIQSNLNTPQDRYKLRQGLWVAIGIADAEASNYLQDYVLDLDSMLFPVRHRSTKNLLASEYMVVELALTPKKP